MEQNKKFEMIDLVGGFIGLNCFKDLINVVFSGFDEFDDINR